MKRLIRWLIRDESGAEGTEYVLVGTLVALGTLAGATAFAGTVNDLFNSIAILVDSSIPVV